MESFAVAKVPGGFEAGADPRRSPGGKRAGAGRTSNKERAVWGKILGNEKVQAAILSVLSEPEKFKDIWNRTLEHAANRAHGPIPHVTATVDGSMPGGLGPSPMGAAIALMQTSPAPQPPAPEEANGKA